ncbi:MAG: alpha/beta fold hydrolase [Thermoleophilaceae bacterium]
MAASPNIVLVHGASADGSSWSAVIEHLHADDYNVTAPEQRPQTLGAERQFAARVGADTAEVAVAMVSHSDEAVDRIVTAAGGVTAAGI